MSQQDINPTIPDLREVPLDQLAKLGDSVLAHSIATYRQRIKGNEILLNSFNSGI